MRVYIFSFIILVSATNIFAQGTPVYLYQLEDKVMHGNKAALYEVVNYLFSDKSAIEYLGYHRLETSEASIAYRIIEENCLLPKEVFDFKDSAYIKKLLEFMLLKKDSINFDTIALAFVLIPLAIREVNIKTRELSGNKRKELQGNEKQLMNLNWVKLNKIDLLIKKKILFHF